MVSKKVGDINAFYRPWPHPGCRFSVVTGRPLLMKGWTSLIKSEKNGKARVTWPEVTWTRAQDDYGICIRRQPFTSQSVAPTSNMAHDRWKNATRHRVPSLTFFNLLSSPSSIPARYMDLVIEDCRYGSMKKRGVGNTHAGEHVLIILGNARAYFPPTRNATPSSPRHQRAFGLA